MSDQERNYLVYLEDIQESMERILSFIENMTYDEFEKDIKTQDAVIRNFEIIGEAANNLPSNFKEQYTSVPWGKMYGLRNIVSHEYFGIDFKLIWKISSSQLPENLKQISKIIKIEKAKN